jgi:hypothetical protein
MTNAPRITIGYDDSDVILRTSGGDVRVTPRTAAGLAIGLIRALHDLGAHQELLRDVEDAFRDVQGHDDVD